MVRKAIIVHESSETRLQLKRLMDGSPQLGLAGVFAFSDPDPALSHFSMENCEWIAFIQHGLAKLSVGEFVEKARAAAGRDRTAFVLLLKPHQTDRLTVSTGMVSGIHGFLREPFTLSALEDLLSVVGGVRKTETKFRLRTAAGLMISALLKEGEEGESEEAARGHSNLWEEAQECCTQYRELTGESISVSVVKELAEKPISKRAHSYSGVSKRVREIVSKMQGVGPKFYFFKKLFNKESPR